MSRPEPVLLVRVPPVEAAGLAWNPALRGRFKFSVLSGEDPAPYMEIGLFQDVRWFPWETKRWYSVVRDLAGEMADRRGFRLAVVLTPLCWFSEAAAEALRARGCEVVWSEGFLGRRLMFDRVGCHYTARNEIDAHADSWPALPPDRPAGTRLPQPPDGTAGDLLELAGGPDAVVLWGQVPDDHATYETAGGLEYQDWVEAILDGNPDTRFVFKHHPHGRGCPHGLTPRIEGRPNVAVVDESLDVLLRAFRLHAAYSSTVILEGALRGLAFATGGRHYLDAEGLRLRVARREDAHGLAARLSAFRPDPDRLARRLAFVTRAYALDPSDPRVLDRLTLTSEDYFKKRREDPP